MDTPTYSEADVEELSRALPGHEIVFSQLAQYPMRNVASSILDRLPSRPSVNEIKLKIEKGETDDVVAALEKQIAIIKLAAKWHGFEQGGYKAPFQEREEAKRAAARNEGIGSPGQ